MSPFPSATDSPDERTILPTEDTWLEIVERQVRSLKFGSVHITIHEGRVVQVETCVRVRFDKPQ